MTSQNIAIGLVAVTLFVGCVTPHGADFYEGTIAYIRSDYATALPIFRQLAEQGEAKAQSLLGIMYQNGLSVTQDYAAAARWYRKAADQGNPIAQFSLGFMYYNGRGVTQDIVQAHMWFNLSVAAGMKDSGAFRDLLAEKMTPEQIAEAQKMARGWKPKKKRGVP